jgi:hypothetical protein
MKHKCPIPSCTTHIASGLLMCPPHWLSVPRSIRTEVNRTWRVFNRAMNGSRDEIDAAMRTYQDAADAAVRVVSEAEAPVCD